MTDCKQDTVHFFDILGGRFTLGLTEYEQLLGSPAMRTYVALVCLLLLLTDAPGLLMRMDLALVLILWVLVVAIFLFATGLALATLAALQDRAGVTHWPGSLIVVLALAPAIGTGEAVTYIATEGAPGFDLFPDVFLYWLIAEAFGVIFFRYVRPNIGPGAPPEARHLLVADKPVPLSELRHIEACEHHVHVTLDGTSMTRRARLSDIIAQTRPEDGIQPHRSWWVSGRVARELIQDGARHLLVLDDNSEVPVARSRVGQVREWLHNSR